MSVINENSTTKEILSEIRYTFMEKEFEVYQGIVVKREDELKTKLKKSKEDYDLLDKKHCLLLLDKLELEKELESIKIEIDLLKKKRSSSEAETHAYANQNMKKPKIETDEESLMELRKENKNSKEEIELYRKMFPNHLNRMTSIEAKLADFLEKHATNFRAENVVDDDHSPDDSICAQIRNSRNPTVAQSSNLHKEGGETMPMGSRENTPSTGLNLQSFASELKNGINEPVTEGGETRPMGSRENTPSTGLNLQNSALDLKIEIKEPKTKATFTEPAAVTVEVTPAAIDRDRPGIIVIESDSSDIDWDSDSDSDDVSIID